MFIDDLDPFKTFVSLKKTYQGAFFFESSELSIIGLEAEEVIRLVGSEVESIKNGSRQIISQDFLTYFSMKLEEAKVEARAFPYEGGGAFGVLGYELAGLLEPRLLRSGVFSQLKGSSEVLAEIFFAKNLIIFQHEKNKIHFAGLSSQVSKAYFKAKDLTPELSSVGEQDFSTLEAHMGEEAFHQNVMKIKSHIKAGDIFQAVLSERFEVKTDLAPLNVYQNVKARCLSAYSFYFDFKESSFFGASPETLVKLSEGTLETHPIAGTRPRGKDEKSDELLERQLKRSSKEGAEHLMLVDLARNDLGRVSKPGTVRIDLFRKLLRLSNVMHLVSVVKGEKAQDKTSLESLGACFPAGTLSGAPKLRAMEILSGLETRARGFYGGAVVAFDHGGNLDSCIAIRSVEMKNGKAILRAGAGIVADSRPEKEYQEIQHKLRALLSAVTLKVLA